MSGAVVKQSFRFLMILAVALLFVSGVACSQKRKPLAPLLLEGEVKPQATLLTEQGTQAFQARRFEDAKRYFEQAVAVAPESGQAHYNYALALNALGNGDVARRHFMEAADLAPGDKIIWDSPALAQYGNPDTATKSRWVERPYGTTNPTFGNMPRGY